MDDTSLFGDLGIAERIVGESDTRDQMAEQAWSLWTAVTNRPKSSIPDSFKKLYIELLDLKYQNEHLLRCVRGAAHLPPRPRDPRDLKRVIDALNKYDIEAEALSLLDCGDSPIYTWEYDETKILCSAKDIARHCNLSMDMWTTKEHQSAGVLVMTLTPERLSLAAERVRLYVGQESIFPSEIIRNSAVWKNPDAKIEVKAVNGRDTYSSGAKESVDLGEIEIELDESAEKYLVRGCPASKIRDFHLEAPYDYWNRVAEMFEERDDLELSEVYTVLQDEFEWHPDNRDAPRW